MAHCYAFLRGNNNLLYTSRCKALSDYALRLAFVTCWHVLNSRWVENTQRN